MSDIIKLQWECLQSLSHRENLNGNQALSKSMLLEWTRSQDEHPEDYEGECECQLCMSYAADDL